MPLRDHFRPPLDNRTAWEGFHSGWPMMIVLALSRKLPSRYVAAPGVHSGTAAEIDVATYDEEELGSLQKEAGNGEGGVATAVWAPPHPTLTVATDLPAQDEYEVLVYDSKRAHRLVAAIEIVSPANKDRPSHRRDFVARCAALLQKRVSVTILDLVTIRQFNLYADLLEMIARTDPSLGEEPPSLYAVACRASKRDRDWLLEAWAHELTVGQPLPTLPLWLAEDLAVPLELEDIYEETCRALRIPRP